MQVSFYQKRSSERSISFTNKLKRGALVALAMGSIASLTWLSIAPTSTKAEDIPTNITPLNNTTAQQIKTGDITLENGTVDTLLFNYGPLNPTADDDQDGLANKDELFTYEKNGKTYLYYKSHPRLADTDGDGYNDKEDSDPLAWNVSARDAIIGQELTYRDDNYINRVLEGKRPLSDQELYKGKNETQGRLEYRLMNREWGPYWEREESFHWDTGFDASLFKFSNKTLPFLKQGTYILAIRGTSDNKDVASDAKLGLGTWPDQATSAVDLAKIINARQDKIKNLTVTGHSLGGYLTQFFAAHSLGLYYGNPKNGFTKNNELYWEPKKFYNTSIKHSYTFNAPKIVAGYLSPTTQEYARLSEIINKELPISNYVVANDSVTAVTGAPKGYIALPNSDQGHSSRSFFEDKFINQPGFSVGKRRGLSGIGYQDPEIMLIEFNKLSHVRFVTTENIELKQERFALSEKALGAVDFSTHVPTNYVIDPAQLTGGRARATYGTTTTFKALGKPVTVTYHYDLVDENNSPVATNTLGKDEQDALKDTQVSTRYDQAYTVPATPLSPNVDFRYEVVDTSALTAIAPKDLTEDKTVNVKLRRIPVLLTTTVKLLQENTGTVLLTHEYQTKPSDTNTIAFDNKLVPEHYNLVPGQDEKLNIKPGSTIELLVRGEPLTISYKYEIVDETGAKLALNSLSEQEKQTFQDFNREGRYQEELTATNKPNLESLSEDYLYELLNPEVLAAIPAEQMTKDQELVIRIKRSEKKVETSLRFVDVNSGTTLDTIKFTTKQSEKDKIVVAKEKIPAHYELVAGEEDKLNLDPGSHTSIKVQGEKLNVTYTFVILNEADEVIATDALTPAEQQAFSTVVKEARYKQAVGAFELMDLNQVSPDYSYELINPNSTEPLPAQDVVENKTIAIKLRRTEHKIATRVEYQDVKTQEILKTLSFTSSPSDKNPIDISGQDLPPMYELVAGEESKLQVTPGSNTTILLQGVPVTLSWHYILLDEAGKTIPQEKLSAKEQAAFQDFTKQVRYKQGLEALSKPNLEEIDEDYSYKLLTPEVFEAISDESVYGDMDFAIRIERKEKKVNTLVKFVDSAGNSLGELKLETKPSEKENISLADKLPAHYVVSDKDQDKLEVKPGSTTTITLVGEPITVKYNYELTDEQGMLIPAEDYSANENKVFTSFSQTGRYKETLNAQTKPDLSAVDEDFKYELQNADALSEIPDNLMLADKEITLKVKRSAVKVVTVVEYRDAQNDQLLNTYQVITKPSEKELIDVSLVPLPESYKLVAGEENKLQVKPGSTTVLKLEKIEVTPEPTPEPDPEPVIPTPDPDLPEPSITIPTTSAPTTATSTTINTSVSEVKPTTSKTGLETTKTVATGTQTTTSETVASTAQLTSSASNTQELVSVKTTTPANSQKHKLAKTGEKSNTSVVTLLLLASLLAVGVAVTLHRRREA